MLKLEDFKIKEIKTLEAITGGKVVDSIWTTKTVVNFLGWVLPIGEQGDSCQACDTIPD